MASTPIEVSVPEETLPEESEDVQEQESSSKTRLSARRRQPGKSSASSLFYLPELLGNRLLIVSLMQNVTSLGGL